MIFYDQDHKYEQDGILYTSVSHIIHSLQKPKNWKLIAKNYAAKVGKTTAEVEEDWKKENVKSVERGKAYHSCQQQSLNSIGVVQRKNVQCAVKFQPQVVIPGEPPSFFIAQPDFKLENNTVYTEMMVWDNGARICGTADEIEVINNTIHINDHKTNKEIKTEGFYVKNQGREKLLPPVSHLDDCNWNHYCIQLSMYMHMLWKNNKHLKVGNLTLNHVRFDHEGNITGVIPMKVPYLRDEVKAIIEWWKAKNN